MNIFVLHTDPQLAALYHCDQHVNKMIVESAQMLSVAVHQRPEFASIRKYVMKQAYENHPCTVWTRERHANMLWLCQMATELENQRCGTNARENAASSVIRVVQEAVLEVAGVYNAPSRFIFCGPEDLRKQEEYSVVTRYRALYVRKMQAWAAEKHKMSYKGRPLPEFMADFSDTIDHGYQPGKFDEMQLIDLFCAA
jgi:hypothetical protein